MPRIQDSLFSEGDLSNLASGCPQMVEQEVNKIGSDQLLSTPEDDLVRYIVDTLTMEPITIYEDRMTIHPPQEVQVDVSGAQNRHFWGPGPYTVPGVRVTVTLPFTGDTRLWKIAPDNPPGPFIISRPYGNVISYDGHTGAVEMAFEMPSDENTSKAKQYLETNLNYMREALKAQHQILNDYHNRLPKAARDCIVARRNRLTKNNDILKALNIPIQARPGAPIIEPLPIRKRIITPLPPPPRSGYQPEPGISDEVFENILAVIRHEGRTYEATPLTFAVHDEEELRDILLAHLNGHFQGQATGETFRRSGKTDIRIEDQNRAAFIGECKVWRGTEELLKAIDQLLSYLTWRDCKASLIIFNKHNKGFAEIQKQIPQALAQHSRFMKQVSTAPAGEWRFVLRSQDDDARLVHCHVFAFNLFTESKKYHA